MSDINRREAVKVAAGLALGTGLFSASEVRSEVAKPSLTEFLESSMFAEEVTFQTNPDHAVLEISPIAESAQGYEVVSLRLGTLRVFLANLEHDDFTKQGGLYWTCGDQKGTFQLTPRAGASQMVLREKDGTVRCFSLIPDFRC